MMEKDKNMRIKDIAEMAGVSTGTVDRILHNRGKVSEEARKKVDEVLKKIDYHPNLIARSLALKKKYRLLVIIPHFEEGEYWQIVNDGIDKAAEELASYNIEVERHYFNQYDQSSFNALFTIIENQECHGVLMATLFKESALEFSRKLDILKIPYILIDAYIDQTNCLAYYGTNSYDSGYIAAKLIFEQIRPDDNIAIFRFIRKGNISSTQVSQREEGFRDYMKKHNHRGEIFPVHIHADKSENNKEILDSFFLQHPEVHNGIIFNSKVHVLCDYFKDHTNSEFKLIGYDILKENVKYLNEGLVTHLIAQRPEVQGFNSIRALFRYLILKEKVEQINYMPIDILMKENINYYNNYI
ncbi:LacI family DNA-binding transcriptional regulator [Parabacteroides pacaensis]|uniref:LacI family DNA-binding transcriptional regulator n=1 Tax=Parabacteroides pacaensis TaxID=2086575 RepID=UPI000D0F467D|nr:substrate-binding domain-containing protein [Parabacteroides pacaensis]